MKATAKDLRFHSKELLASVARGEEVIITYRGKPYAKLVPFKNEKVESEGGHRLFGMWKDYESLSNVDEYLRKRRKGRF